MADVRRVTDTFSVAPQIHPETLADLARQGFRLVINNRPDQESADQPPSTVLAIAARDAGLEYRHIPVRGAPGAREVEAFAAAVSGADGPVLAFCRSGTRSIVTWALGERAAGRTTDELVRLGREAGYDLSAML